MRLVGRSHARGFSLIEIVITVAISVVVGWLLFHVLAQLLLAGRQQAARDLELSTIAQLTDKLATEEDDAWAIYAPPADALGRSNSDGHEVDFYTRDGRGQTYFWAYDYDAATHTVQRFRSTSPGGAPSADVSYSGITAFSAHTYPVTALQDAATPVYSALYAGAALQSGIVHFFPAMPWIAGGNNITYVHFEGATIKRDLQLVTQTAPSGFTVVLNYTPSPAPTVTPAAPTVWPAAIVFAPAGMTIAYGGMQQRAGGFAELLNRMLGGGIAYAQIVRGCGLDCPRPSPRPTVLKTPTPSPATPTPQPATPTPQPATPTPQPATPTPQLATPTPSATSTSGCTAIAFADAAMTQPLPPNSVNPYTGQVVVDANGCYAASGTSAQFWVHEDGYVNAFFDATNECTSGLFAGSWNPTTANGPTAAQMFTAGSQFLSRCAIAFTDSENQRTTAYAAVMFPNPMYAQVNLTTTSWVYDCADMKNGICWNGGWQNSGGTSYTEYVSANQGVTWQTVASCSSSSTCPYVPQFINTEQDCTSEAFRGGNCPGTGYMRPHWDPFTPPNAP